ncbi:MAG: hypothetical protein L0Y80_12015 [Ignavibacteriae bacterium]|nr:hypothetical protein [Ignavibacteriota bacterium]
MTKAKRIERQINKYKRLEGDNLFGDLCRGLKRDWIELARKAGFKVVEKKTVVRVTK